MNKLMDIIGERFKRIGTVLLFMLMGAMVLLAYSPFIIINSIYSIITITFCFSYSLIIIYKVIRYFVKKAEK